MRRRSGAIGGVGRGRDRWGEGRDVPDSSGSVVAAGDEKSRSERGGGAGCRWVSNGEGSNSVRVCEEGQDDFACSIDYDTRIGQFSDQLRYDTNSPSRKKRERT